MNVKNLLKKIVPTQNKVLYSLCKRFVDQYNNENNGDMHTNGELRLIHSILPKCLTVFDIGANIGEWTKLALKIKPDLTVHCFEPSTTTFKILDAQKFGNNVKCNNLGMSSSPGILDLHIYEDGSGLNSLYSRRGLEDGFQITSPLKIERVNLTTIDIYCKDSGIDYIDFLKIDVEGHELQVFKGASGMLSKGKIKYIQFEYGGCNIDSGVLLKDLFDFFSSYDFTFFKIYPNSLKRVSRYDQRLENFQYQNWIIIKD